LDEKTDDGESRLVEVGANGFLRGSCGDSGSMGVSWPRREEQAQAQAHTHTHTRPLQYRLLGGGGMVGPSSRPLHPLCPPVFFVVGSVLGSSGRLQRLLGQVARARTVGDRSSGTDVAQKSVPQHQSTVCTLARLRGYKPDGDSSLDYSPVC
jgi:hypothetical protein